MNKIQIGKYTLESLTKGLYKDPLVIYREYIQNSLDSIDDFENQSIEGNESIININIDRTNKYISIEDNGKGIATEKAFKLLTSIGMSNKLKDRDRGFRGIGRLSGLGYCEKLVFTTSCLGSDVGSKLEISSIELMKSIYENSDEELSDVLGKNMIYSEIIDKKESHYFKVEMINVTERNSLLNELKANQYVSEFLPVPFNKAKFTKCEKINKFIKKNNLDYKFYNININGNKVIRQYSDNFIVGQTGSDIERITDISVGFIEDYSENKIAWYWYSESNYCGTIHNNSIKGIRLKSKGIGVGDRGTLNHLFKEERFNGWFQGEIHILDDNIIPNASRENYEETDSYIRLKDLFKELADKLSNDIRKASINRNKVIKKAVKHVNSDLISKLDKHMDTLYSEKSNLIEIRLKSEFDDKTVKRIMSVINE